MKIENVSWLAVAREAIIRAGALSEEADDAMQYLTDAHANITERQKVWAYEFCSVLEDRHTELSTEGTSDE